MGLQSASLCSLVSPYGSLNATYCLHQFNLDGSGMSNLQCELVKP